MGFEVTISDLHYEVNKKKILKGIDFNIPQGIFLAVLGENGAGKTTLLDLLMGFRIPTSGKVTIDNKKPFKDNWQQREGISYLSEKVDIPGDWSVHEFFKFNRFFYNTYSEEREQKLISEFKIDVNNRIGNMSAGEIRRVQLAAALSYEPRLIIADEITAVLDIIGRRKFMKILHEQNQSTGCTVIIATNVLEDLVNYISHVFLLSKGEMKRFKPLDDFLNGHDKIDFSQLVADILE